MNWTGKVMAKETLGWLEWAVGKAIVETGEPTGKLESFKNYSPLNFAV